MIFENRLLLKKIVLRFLLIIFGLIFSYILFVSVYSISIGIRFLHHDGFWVPVLAGLLSIGVFLVIFILFSRFVSSQLKEKDIIQNI